MGTVDFLASPFWGEAARSADEGETSRKSAISHPAFGRPRPNGDFPESVASKLLWLRPTNGIKGALLATAVAGMFLAGNAIADEAKPTDAKVKCMGINACKGHGGCAGAGHDCGGKNECKGKGFVETSAADCKAKGGQQG